MAPIKTLDFKCALITGGSGGLGRGMAEALIKMGKEVIIAGRTEKHLKQTAEEIKAKAYFVLDTSNVSVIPDFINKVTSKHPEIDCLINNAGIQRPFQILGPDYNFDLSQADQEIDTNIRGPMHLCVGFVSHLNGLKNGGVIMNVSSLLGYCPVSLVNPVYNGTKAWVHFFTMNLRSQLRDAGSKIKVVEIAPPTVETALHRERKDPDDNKKKENESSLSIDEFIKQVKEGWEQDWDVCAAGPAKDAVKKWQNAFSEQYENAGG